MVTQARPSRSRHRSASLPPRELRAFFFILAVFYLLL